MNMKREIKYRYVVNEDKGVVVALSSFAGKDVRGVARCSPADNFDAEMGKKLAVARCDVKITDKRVVRANQMVEFYRAFLTQVQSNLERAEQYREDALVKYQEATEELQKLEGSL
jgi:hypothetical protein